MTAHQLALRNIQMFLSHHPEHAHDPRLLAALKELDRQDCDCFSGDHAFLRMLCSDLGETL